MEATRWEPVTTPRLLGFGVGAALFVGIIFFAEPGFIFLLDHANLLFHEAGHPVLGLLNERLGVYGGTLGQLAFPIILMISFWRKGRAISFAVCWIWFFENFLNIARYMADARALALPLVGGGEHDWNDIFFRWGVLSYDLEIAGVTRAVGWLGMAAGVVWVAWRGWNDRRRNVGEGEAIPVGAL